MDAISEEKPPEPKPANLKRVGVVVCANEACKAEIGTSYQRGRVIIHLSRWYPGVWESGEMPCALCGHLTRVPFEARGRVHHKSM